MNALTDQQLLHEYAERRSEAAFAELVRRHIDLVHSAAFRMTAEAHSAQDVTQAAFVALAQNALRLARHPVLSGWLHTTARNLAAKNVRSDVRRRAREQEAAAMNELSSTEPDALWEQIAPHLDAALGGLNEMDRDAVALRFFEHKSAREMADILGITDEAAQKRVSRAVEHLREFFVKHGISVGAGALATALSVKAIQAAPAGLAAGVSVAALAASAGGAGATASLLKLLTMTKLHTAVIGGIVVGAVVTPLALQYQAKLRGQNESLRQQLARLETRNEALSNSIAQGKNAQSFSDEQLHELLRLRNEVGFLRQQTNQLAKLQEQIRREQEAAAQDAQSAASTQEDLQAQTLSRLNDAKLYCLGIMLYATQNHDLYPTNLDQTLPYLSAQNRFPSGTNQFQILYHGTADELPNPMTNGIIVIRSQPWQGSDGKWNRVYGFADGHCEVHSEANEDFSAWERQHSMQH